MHHLFPLRYHGCTCRFHKRHGLFGASDDRVTDRSLRTQDTLAEDLLQDEFISQYCDDIYNLSGVVDDNHLRTSGRLQICQKENKNNAGS